MRPTTRSPISGVYRARMARTERSLLVRRTEPATVARMEVEPGMVNVPWPLESVLVISRWMGILGRGESTSSIGNRRLCFRLG